MQFSGQLSDECSQPAGYTKREEALMGGPSPEHVGTVQEWRERSYARAETRACFQFKQFPTSCNEPEWKAGSHSRLKSLPCPYYIAVERKLAWECQGPSLSEGHRPEHASAISSSRHFAINGTWRDAPMLSPGSSCTEGQRLKYVFKRTETTKKLIIIRTTPYPAQSTNSRSLVVRGSKAGAPAKAAEPGPSEGRRPELMTLTEGAARCEGLVGF